MIYLSGFILRDGAEFIIGPRVRADPLAPPQDEVLTLMVRSAATPRVSNHVAHRMADNDSTQPENALD
jgi:hypothetical protein